MGFAVTSVTNQWLHTASFTDLSLLSAVLTSPASNASALQPADVVLAAAVTNAGRPVTKVEFYADATKIGEAAGATYTAVWTNPLAGTWSLTARAVDSAGAAVGSAPVPFTVVPAAPVVGVPSLDVTSAGSWLGLRGAEASLIVNDSTNLPATVTVVPTGHGALTWTASTAELRALQRASGAGRLAAAWTSATNFTIQINRLDGQLHRLSAYLLDWDSANTRVERAEVIAATTGQVLNSVVVSNFSNGVYLSWSVRGSVLLRITRLAGSSAVLSGLFFDPASNQPPAVTVSAPTILDVFVVPTNILLAANATDADGVVQRVEFQLDGLVLGVVTNPPYALAWNSVRAGAHTLQARAYDDLGEVTGSSVVPINVALRRAYAGFVNLDTNTAGNWIGRYGQEAWLFPGYRTNWTTWVPYTSTASYTYVQSQNGSNSWALQYPPDVVTTLRLRTFFLQDDYPFSFTVQVLDGIPRRLTMYSYDSAGARNPIITARDGFSGAVLDTRAATNDLVGRYFTWSIQGRVQFDIDSSYYQRSMSAFFLDPETNPPPVVTLTTPPSGYSNYVPVVLRVAAVATDPNGIRKVEFFTADRILGGVTNSPYELYAGGWSAGAHTVFARATDNGGAVADSAPVTLLLGQTNNGWATLVSTDLVTRGSWKGVYGNEGWWIPADSTNLPPSAAITTTLTNVSVLSASSSDPRALQRVVSPSGIQSLMYSGAATGLFHFAVLDGRPHRISFYLSTPFAGKNARVDARRSSDQALLATRTANNYSNAIYLTFEVQGAVDFYLSAVAPDSGLHLAGIFFDSGSPPYFVWRGRYFTDAEQADASISGDTANPDGDPLMNLVEYALGLDPRADSTGQQPVVQLNGAQLCITFTRFLRGGDFTVTPEYSTDLLQWYSGPSYFVRTSVQNTDLNTETVSYCTPFSVDSLESAFVRLRVTRP